jgi:hypothetical protein
MFNGRSMRDLVEDKQMKFIVLVITMLIAVTANAGINDATCGNLPKNFFNTTKGYWYVTGFIVAKLSNEEVKNPRVRSLARIVTEVHEICKNNPNVPVWAVVNGEYMRDLVERERATIINNMVKR